VLNLGGGNTISAKCDKEIVYLAPVFIRCDLAHRHVRVTHTRPRKDIMSNENLIAEIVECLKTKHDTDADKEKLKQWLLSVARNERLEDSSVEVLAERWLVWESWS